MVLSNPIFESTIQPTSLVAAMSTAPVWILSSELVKCAPERSEI